MKKITVTAALLLWVCFIVLGAVVNPSYYSGMVKDYGSEYLLGTAAGEILLFLVAAWIVEKAVLRFKK